MKTTRHKFKLPAAEDDVYHRQMRVVNAYRQRVVQRTATPTTRTSACTQRVVKLRTLTTRLVIGGRFEFVRLVDGVSCAAAGPLLKGSGDGPGGRVPGGPGTDQRKRGGGRGPSEKNSEEALAWETTKQILSVVFCSFLFSAN